MCKLTSVGIARSAAPRVNTKLACLCVRCRLFVFSSSGTGRVGPSRNSDLSVDAHVAHAHGGPSRHGPRAVREHRANPHGSLSGIRTFRSGTGTSSSGMDALRRYCVIVQLSGLCCVLASTSFLRCHCQVASGRFPCFFTLPSPVYASVSTEIFTDFFLLLSCILIEAYIFLGEEDM